MRRHTNAPVSVARLTHLPTPLMTPRSFLPQVVGVSPAPPCTSLITITQLFYATFDPSLGPVVRYQVPENLISDSTAEEARSPSKSRSRSRSRASRFISPSPSPSPLPNRTLLNFGPISEYVIPKSHFMAVSSRFSPLGRGATRMNRRGIESWVSPMS